MSITSFIKEDMIGVREDISKREDYYKGLVENFVTTIYGYNKDREEDILEDYYDQNCPFNIRINGEKIKNVDLDLISLFNLEIHDYLEFGDVNTSNGKQIISRLLDEWTDEFVNELEEYNIISEQEYNEWKEYYYDIEDDDEYE